MFCAPDFVDFTKIRRQIIEMSKDGVKRRSWAGGVRWTKMAFVALALRRRVKKERK